MPIQILPARLANQIAAGEVVERPASVVKELVENSLDAGATCIEIDIEKGGAKCIRIKDNGRGVEKEQLTLALSRHATSKISHLDDLEAIVSLGFRGEALASVSSVSRLTFTSKPEGQEQAWQAIAEGRDMQVNIQPTAHPQGTTVEVLDLFFNTPARRRFLKTEKTEFQHIDELIRRIALSCFDIAFVLKHNGKVIRQYRAAQTQIQKEKRLSSICSDNFVKTALHFQNFDNGLSISGWVSDPMYPRLLNDVQYCYINGRMIRDKLVTHAIKQSYAYALPEGKFAGYVIYIECDPTEVDVNVHPSKHEVRFHQARWVHDFIVSTLVETLKQPSLNDPQPAYQAPEVAHRHDYSAAQTSDNMLGNADQANPAQSSAGQSSNYTGNYSKPNIDHAQVEAYCDFVSENYQTIAAQSQQEHCAFANALCVFSDCYLLLKLNPVQTRLTSSSQLLVLSLTRAERLLKQSQLFEAWCNGEVIAQPLLLPVRIQLEAIQRQALDDFQTLFQRLGFSFKTQANKLIISKVPSLLRQAPVAKILPLLLEYLVAFEKQITEEQVNDFCLFLVNSLQQSLPEQKPWTLDRAEQLVELLINSYPELLKDRHDALFHEPDLSLLLQGFSDE